MIHPNSPPAKPRVDAAKILRTRPFEPYTHVTSETIDSSADTLYTVPASTVSVIQIEVNNNTGASSNLTLYRVESGGSVGVSNLIVNAMPIAPNTSPLRLGPYTLEAAGFISGISSTADALTAHIYVEEYGAGDAVGGP